MNNNIKQDAFMQGLELAARKYAQGFVHKEAELACKQAFIEGGKWMAQQIYNAIKGIVENNT